MSTMKWHINQFPKIFRLERHNRIEKSCPHQSHWCWACVAFRNQELLRLDSIGGEFVQLILNFENIPHSCHSLISGQDRIFWEIFPKNWSLKKRGLENQKNLSFQLVLRRIVSNFGGIIRRKDTLEILTFQQLMVCCIVFRSNCPELVPTHLGDKLVCWNILFNIVPEKSRETLWLQLKVLWLNTITN